jgi:hypothetical protein
MSVEIKNVNPNTIPMGRAGRSKIMRRYTNPRAPTPVRIRGEEGREEWKKKKKRKEGRN